MPWKSSTVNKIQKFLPNGADPPTTEQNCDVQLVMEIEQNNTYTLNGNGGPNEDESKYNPNVESELTNDTESHLMGPSEIDNILVSDLSGWDWESASENSPTSSKSSLMQMPMEIGQEFVSGLVQQIGSSPSNSPAISGYLHLQVRQRSTSEVVVGMESESESKPELPEISSALSSPEVGHVTVQSCHSNSISESTNESLSDNSPAPGQHGAGNELLKRRKKMQPIPPHLPPKPKRKPKKVTPKDSSDDDYDDVPAESTKKTNKLKQKEKKRRHTKADIEVLNDIENPRPSTSAALVNEMARIKKLLETSSSESTGNRSRESRSKPLNPAPSLKSKVPVLMTRSARNLRANCKAEPIVVAPEQTVINKEVPECEKLIRDIPNDDEVAGGTDDEPKMKHPKTELPEPRFNSEKRKFSVMRNLHLQKPHPRHSKRLKENLHSCHDGDSPSVVPVPAIDIPADETTILQMKLNGEKCNLPVVKRLNLQKRHQPRRKGLKQQLRSCHDEERPSPIPIPLPAKPAIQSKALRIALIRLTDDDVRAIQKNICNKTPVVSNSEVSLPVLSRGTKRRQEQVQISTNTTRKLVKVEMTVPTSNTVRQLRIMLPLVNLEGMKNKQRGTKEVKTTLATKDIRKSIRPRKPRSIIDL